MSSKLDVWNMAIGHLGESVEINSESENTALARACRRYWETCREKVLKDAPWPFATRYTNLAQVTTGIPVSEYRYAYRYPSDAVTIRRILNGTSRVESQQSRVKFNIAGDSQGALVLCDVQPLATASDPSLNAPFIEYTINETDVTRFSADFVLALSYLLARSIGPRIAADKSKLITDCMVLYEREIVKARINALNEDTPDEPQQSEFERSRI